MPVCPPGYHWYDPGKACVSDIATGPVPPARTVDPQSFWEGPAVEGLFTGIGNWTRANPLITAGIIVATVWIVSGRKIPSLRRLI